VTAAIRRALRAWRARHPSRLARLLAAHERDEMRRAERLAPERRGPLDDGRRT
jgi:hypothetical protein